MNRFLHLLFVFVNIDYYEIIRNQEILYKDLLSIPEINIQTDTKKFEIDIIIRDFSIEDFKKIQENIPKHFFFIDKLHLKTIQDKKVNIISEICINLINEVDKKLNQIDKYITIFDILSKIKNQNLLILTKENYRYIFDSFPINFNNENIFILIIDGSYLVLMFVINILKKIFEEEQKKILEEKEIMEIINIEFLKNYNDTIKNIIGNIEIIDSFNKYVFKFYTLFHKLRKKKIRHCLFYIGKENENEYEENLLNFLNIEKSYKNNEQIIEAQKPKKEEKKVLSQKSEENKTEKTEKSYEKPDEKYEKKSDKKIDEKQGGEIYDNKESQNEKKIKKELSLDDIVINYKIKIYINELNKIKYGFFSELKKLSQSLRDNLNKNINKINNYFADVNLEDKELFSIKFYINNEFNEKDTIDKIKALDNFYIKKLSFFDTGSLINKINNLEHNDTDLILFIDKNNKVATAVKNCPDNNVFYFSDLNDLSDDIKDILQNYKSNNLKKRLFSRIPKKYHNSEGILNFEKLSEKINNELKIKINPKEMEILLNIEFDTEKKKEYINNIEKNINELYQLFGLKSSEKNINALKEKFNKAFPFLIENFKASIFYDYIYLSVYPKIKKEILIQNYGLKGNI